MRGDFGECLWDEQSARAVMSSYEARGNPVPIDCEHNSNLVANPRYDPSQPPEGGGYLWLRVERGPTGPTLWLDPIQWSSYARAQIESGSRRCISPDWDYEPSTGRVLRLNKVSLVQNPGTYGIGLVASARGKETQVEETLDMFLAALEAALTAEDPKPAIEALVSKVRALKGGTGGEPAAPDLPAVPGALAGDDADPLEDKIAKAVAAGLQRAGVAPATVAPVRAQAPSTSGLTASSVRDYVRAELADAAAKDTLIASARKDGRPMSEALAAKIKAMPLKDAREIVAALPRPEVPAGTTPATAAADPGAASSAPVNVGPHGTEPAAVGAKSTREASSIEAIQRAALTRDQRIAAARAAATDKDGKPIVSEGNYSFSALSQMRDRKKTA